MTDSQIAIAIAAVGVILQGITIWQNRKRD